MKRDSELEKLAGSINRASDAAGEIIIAAVKIGLVLLAFVIILIISTFF
jgi:hypothetical protein